MSNFLYGLQWGLGFGLAMLIILLTGLIIVAGLSAITGLGRRFPGTPPSKST